MSLEYEKIKQLTCELTGCDCSAIIPTIRFHRDLGMDSLDMYQLAVEIEAYFSIKLSDAHIAQMQTPGDAAEIVSRL